MSDRPMVIQVNLTAAELDAIAGDNTDDVGMSPRYKVEVLAQTLLEAAADAIINPE